MRELNSSTWRSSVDQTTCKNSKDKFQNCKNQSSLFSIVGGSNLAKELNHDKADEYNDYSSRKSTEKNKSSFNVINGDDPNPCLKKNMKKYLGSSRTPMNPITGTQVTNADLSIIEE